MASQPASIRTAALEAMTDEECAELLYDWRFHARQEQLPPEGDWRTWLMMTGRGFGKTRSGAEWIREKAEAGVTPLALIGATAADVRDTMVEGDSGVLACCPPSFRPEYEPSKRRLTWPNGARATTFSADKPDRLRGPQHAAAWCDEISTWRYMRDAWQNLMLGLRVGANPQVVVTTTPRPCSLLKELIADPTTHLTRGRTYDNTINLAPAFREEIIARYEGTRIGRQELEGELLEDVPGALWTRATLDANRVAAAPELVRIVIAVDPAMTSGEEADETGIVAAGVDVDGEGYVLGDYSCRMTPNGWAHRVVNAYEEHKADRVVAEVNNGGDLVELNVRTVAPSISYKGVHASRGKRVRAEPVAALYEQGRIHHVGEFAELEDQQCNFVPDAMDASPDRVDALVWAFTELMLEGSASGLALPDDEPEEDEALEAAGLGQFM